MFKKLNIILVLCLALSVFIACGKETNDEKTEEELRAELTAQVKAEMAEEALQAEAEAGNSESDATIDNQTNNEAVKEAEKNEENENDAKESEAPSTQESEVGLLDFQAVFNGNNPLEAIDYFNTYYDEFDSDQRFSFAEEIVNVLMNYAVAYEQIALLSTDKEMYGPVSGLDIGDYYSYYSLQENTLNIAGLEPWVQSTIKDIEANEILLVAKWFWATDGTVEDGGFGITFTPEVAAQLEKALELVFEDQKPEYYSINPIYFPNSEFSTPNENFDSNVVSGYPQVYINTPDLLGSFENEAVWKTIVLLPVTVIDDAAALSVDSSTSGADNTPVSGLSGFESEIINDVPITYSDYTDIIIPQYNGVNLDVLARRTASFSDDMNNAKLTFAVFGVMEDIEITFYQGMDSDGEVESIGTLQNSYLDIYAPLNDMSYVKVTGQVHNGAEYIKVEFNLDDMRDPSNYDFYRF